MKRFLIIVFAICVVFVASAQEFRHVIKVSPIGMLFGQFSGTYEKVVAENSSFLINANYLDRDFLGVNTKSFGGAISYRYYLQNEKLAPIGLYISPGFSYSNYSIGQDVIDASSFAMSAVGGHQWVWNSGFSLDLNIGFQYAVSTDATVSTVNLSSFSGVVPKFGVSLGWGF